MHSDHNETIASCLYPILGMESLNSKAKELLDDNAQYNEQCTSTAPKANKISMLKISIQYIYSIFGNTHLEYKIGNLKKWDMIKMFFVLPLNTSLSVLGYTILFYRDTILMIWNCRMNIQ